MMSSREVLFKRGSLHHYVWIAIAYFILARAGLYLATLQANASPVWPATGFAIAVLHLLGWEYFVAIAVGAFAANFTIGSSIPIAFAISLGNTGEALVGTIILKRLLNPKSGFSYQNDVIAYGTAAIVSSSVSATIGVLALWSSDAITSAIAIQVWFTWWMGDILGCLIFAPFLVNIRQLKIKPKSVKHLFGVIFSGIAAYYIVFEIPDGSGLLFLIFPVILYAASRLGETYALVTPAVFSALAITATINGHGPFTSGGVNDQLVDLQVFMAAVALTGLTLLGFLRTPGLRFPIALPLACWTLTGALFFSFQKSEQDVNESRFNNLIEDTLLKIAARTDAYRDALRGGAGLYQASRSVEPEEWARYTQSLQIGQHSPGILGLGVVWPVMTQDFDEFETAQRKAGLDDYHIRPQPGFELDRVNPKLHFINKYFEPRANNEEFLGRDMGADPARRLAAEESRDSGSGTITPTVTLYRGGTPHLAFILLKPIYRNEMPLDTVEQRRLAHLGWVYGPVIYEKYFSSLLGEKNLQLGVKIHQAGFSDATHLVFQSDDLTEATPHSTSEISIGSQKLNIQWFRKPGFVSAHSGVLPWVGFGGALFSLLVTIVIMNLRVLRQRAQQMADEMVIEIKQSRELLKQSERRLLYALEGSSDGIWDWDLEKGEIYVSKNLAQYFGGGQVVSVESDVMRTVIHPDDIEFTQKSITDHLEGKTFSHEAQSRLRSVSGEWKWFLTRGKISEYNLQGKPVRMTGMHINIERMKTIEAELASAQQNFKNIADTTPALICRWNSDLQLIFANKIFFDWMNLKPENVIGKKLEDLTAKPVYEQRLPLFKKVLEGQPQYLESEIQQPGTGKTRYMISSYLPEYVDGKVQGFISFAQDVTELKEAQMTAEMGKKMALEATQIKSQFLANMSHEIRTPINCIVGMAGLMMDTPLKPEQQEYMENLKSNVDALLSLVNDVLDFSKIEAGKLELENIEFDLKDLISNLSKSMSYAARQKSVSIGTAGLDGLERRYWGDPGRLRQVLTNLISNAIKFTPQGQIIIRLNKIREQDDMTLMRFEVQDSGIGIPDDKIGYLFQAFSQSDASTTRKYGGTGLGLSISKQLVDLFGGKIGVHSKENVGSTFWFELNLKLGSPIIKTQETAETHSNRGRFQGARVLVAEDNSFNQIVLTKMLEKMGIRSDVVLNGSEAVNAVKELPYDLVLMDCNMPEMDGFEATRQIRASKNSDLTTIPIIAVTANAFIDAREECLAAGMNDFVSKPIQENELARALEAWLPKKNKAIDVETLSVLEELQIPGEPDILIELIDRYLEKTFNVVAEIEKAIPVSNAKKISDELHQLKSSSRTLGAKHLGDLCETVERLAKKSQMSKVEEKWPDLKTAIDAAQKELQAIKALRQQDGLQKSG